MYFEVVVLEYAVISGSLSPRHGESSGLPMDERPLMWRGAANVLNRQSRTADKGWSSSLGVGGGAYN
jgi:hypothetical protein